MKIPLGFSRVSCVGHRQRPPNPHSRVSGVFLERGCSPWPPIAPRLRGVVHEAVRSGPPWIRSNGGRWPVGTPLPRRPSGGPETRKPYSALSGPCAASLPHVLPAPNPVPPPFGEIIAAGPGERTWPSFYGAFLVSRPMSAGLFKCSLPSMSGPSRAARSRKRSICA